MHVRNDASSELLSYMEVIDASNDRYQMMPEYLSQLLLQRFCRSGNKITKTQEQQFFDNESLIGQTLYIHFKEEELQAFPHFVKALAAIEDRYNEWIMYIVILYELELFKNDARFIIVCKGIAEMINTLVDYDNIQNGQGIERGKVLTKPFYPLPTETLYVTKSFKKSSFFLASIQLLFHQSAHYERKQSPAGTYITINFGVLMGFIG